MVFNFVPENCNFLRPHAENGVTEEWLTSCSGTWGGRDAIQIYLVYLRIDGLFFFQDEVSVQELDKGFCFLKPKHFSYCSAFHERAFVSLTVANILYCF